MRSLHIAESFYDFVTEVRAEEVKQVQKCLRLIKEDPANPSLRRHKLNRIRSKNVVSYSPNQDIRIIAYEPTNEETYLLYVGHHDDAYNWAANRRIDHDDLSKVIRIARVEARDLALEDADNDKTKNSTALDDLIGLLPERVKGAAYMFDAHTDAELQQADIPAAYMALVRKVQTEADIMFLVGKVPQVVGEGIFSLAAEAGAPQKAAQQDEAPIATVAQVAEVVQYKTLETDEALQEWIDDLEQALAKPFDEWRRFLHPAQRKAVQARSKGPLRVTGAAGTGKTVVGIHRAKHLGETEFNVVHFLTYNRSLMNNLLGLVKDVFGSALGHKYRVNTYHAFADQRVKEVTGKRLEHVEPRVFLDAGLSVVQPKSFGNAWDETAAGQIYREIIHVIAPQRIRNMASYVRASRKGLDRQMSIPQKEEVWRVYEAAWAEAKAKLRIPYDLVSHFALEENLPPLSGEALVVDEVQDLQAVDLAFLAQQAPGPNQLTLLEDAKQRIYGPGYSLKALGINVVGRRSITLFVNYRTTAEIGTVASRSLKDLGLPETEWPRPLRSGRAAEVKVVESAEQERVWITKRIQDCQKRGIQRIGVLARTRRTLEDLEPMLQEAGLDFAKLDRNQSVIEPGVISLCTMHSSKGLEFEVVFVMGLNYGLSGMRPPTELRDDKVLTKDFERRERHLLYVALSRARDELYVSGKGEALKCL